MDGAGKDARLTTACSDGASAVAEAWPFGDEGKTMISNPETGILQTPLAPDLMRTCPRCGKKLALEFVRKDPDEAHYTISIFRCRFCQETTEFATSHRPESV